MQLAIQTWLENRFTCFIIYSCETTNKLYFCCCTSSLVLWRILIEHSTKKADLSLSWTRNFCTSMRPNCNQIQVFVTYNLCDLLSSVLMTMTLVPADKNLSIRLTSPIGEVAKTRCTHTQLCIALTWPLHPLRRDWSPHPYYAESSTQWN